MFKERLPHFLKKLLRLLPAAGFLICAISSAALAGDNNKSLTIAVLPCADVVMTIKKFNPLANYLKEETGFEIKLVVPSTLAVFEKALKTGDFEFAFQDPHTYLALTHFFQPDSLLSTLNREGEATQQSVVIARKDGAIKELEDLKGKKVMFGNDLSAAKWVAAREMFEKQGIDIDNDLHSYSQGGCCEDIAFNVYLNVVDAGVVCDHFLAKHSDRQKELGVETGDFVIVSQIKPVQSKVFAAHRNTGSEIADKVNRALLKLDKTNPAHAEILFRAELGGFEKARDED